jgi:hypothetical protein
MLSFVAVCFVAVCNYRYLNRSLTVARTSIIIDDNWLVANGPSPYILSQSGTTYTLAVDVIAPNTAFCVAGDSIILDLGGHTVTYDTASPVEINNSGFEEGSGTNVPGWNLSSAPLAAIAPNSVFLFGNQVLKVTNAVTPQTIVSDPVAIPTTNRWYAATVTAVQATPGTTVQLNVLDTVTSQVIATGNVADPILGYAAVVRFRPTTTNALAIQLVVTPAAGVSSTVYLDDADLRFSDDYGVLAPGAWTSDIPGWQNLPPTITFGAPAPATNVSICNGTIVQGQASGYASAPLYLVGVGGATLKNLMTTDSGMDIVTVNCNGASGSVSITGCILTQNTNNISNRQLTFATVNATTIQGDLDMTANVVQGSRQIGLKLGGVSGQTIVKGNTFRQNSIVTNAYGILISSLCNFLITQNTIMPISGRGIDLDGYSGAVSANGVISNNSVYVSEGFNREYPTDNAARALRIRNDVGSSGSMRNISIRGNSFVAQTGPGLSNAAYGCRVSLLNSNGAMDNAGIVLRNNTFKAISVGGNPNTYYSAQALVIDGVDPKINPLILDNILESNDTSLVLGQADYSSVNDVYLQSNVLRLSTDGTRQAYTGILAGYWNRTLNHVSLVATTADQGANTTILWSGTGTKSIVTGGLTKVSAMNGSHHVLPGVSVSITDNVGHVVYSGVTNAQGVIGPSDLLSMLYQQQTADPTQITISSFMPFTATALFPGAAGAKLSFSQDSGTIYITVANGIISMSHS